MNPSLWILSLLLFARFFSTSVGASPTSPLPRRLLSNDTTATPPTSTTTLSSEFCSACNSRILPHSRTLTITVVAIFVACVIMAFVSVYARRFCIQDSNMGENYYSMEMCRGDGGNDTLVKSLPVVKYGGGEDESKKTMKECAVCLSEFESGEMLRLLPACDHLFHKDCIDMWLFSHSTCPICRISLLTHGSGSHSGSASPPFSDVVDVQPMLPSSHSLSATTAAG